MELVALPPFVITAIVPVVALVGTVAVIFESKFTVNEADTLLNVTFVACLRPVPVIVTEVPTGPPGGVKVAKVSRKTISPLRNGLRPRPAKTIRLQPICSDD